MGVIDFGTGDYLVKFDDSYADGLFAVQGETARTYHFIVTDLNNQAIDTSNLDLKMNVFVKRTKAGTAPSVRQADGSFLMTIPQGLILEHDENAKYQLFLRDNKGNMLAQKEGPFKVFANRAYDSSSGTNLLFDFEEFQKALDMQEEYLEQMSDNLDRTIIARDEAQTSALESTSAKDESQRIETRLKDTLDKELERQKNETERISNESTRKSNETERINAENKRLTSETERVSSENTRKSYEETRVSNENTRKDNEEIRVSAETTRAETMKRWFLQFEDIVSRFNEIDTTANQRTEEWTNLKSELETLMNQLKDIDAGNLQLQINDLAKDIKGYVKYMQVNTVNNTIEVFAGNDVNTPSITLKLPKGFSGKYADLEGKPNIYIKSEIDSKFKAVNTELGSKVSADATWEGVKSKTDAIPESFDYSLKDYAKTTDMNTKLNTNGGTMTGQLIAQNNTAYTTAQVRNIAVGTSLLSTTGFGNGVIYLVREP